MVEKAFIVDENSRVGVAMSWRANQKELTLKELEPLLEKYKLNPQHIHVTGVNLCIKDCTETSEKYSEDLVKRADSNFKKRFKKNGVRKDVRKMVDEINEVISDCYDKSRDFDDIFHIVFTSPIYKRGVYGLQGKGIIVILETNAIKVEDEYLLEGLTEITLNEYQRISNENHEQMAKENEKKWKMK